MTRSLIVLFLLTTAAHADPSISFDTTGGDAWTFTLDVAGRASREQCASVTVESPLGGARAMQTGDRFYARVQLGSGENRVTAICSKHGRTVARSLPQMWHVRLDETPKAWIRVRAFDTSISLDAGGSQLAPGQPAPLVKFEWRARPGNPAPLRLADGRSLDSESTISGERIELAVPNQNGEYYVGLDATDAAGRVDRSTGVFRVHDGLAREVDLRTTHPSWWDCPVVYGAAPYFFEPANFGGVRARLQQIAALGATALWLSPVTAAAPDDFGYAVTDQFRLREQFGSDGDFRTLVEAAHGVGLRVLVDFVPNHLADRSDYFQDAARNATRSPYYAWFDRDAGGAITHYFDWRHLANLDYDNPQVRAYVTAAFVRFVRDFGVDGFRVDASWAVARRAPEFWPKLREELKRIDPDVVLLAEASAREPYPFVNGFDTAYDWTSQLGEWAWRDAFADDGLVRLDLLRAALINGGKGPVPDAHIFRFLNNNDTGARFVTRFGLQLAKVAATLLFTVPGVPLIYNGDEAGASFEPYEEGPPIQWNDGGELASHYRRLAKLRRHNAPLCSRELQLLSTDRDDVILAYTRPGASAADEVLVLLNFSAKSITVRPTDAASRAAFRRFRRPYDLLGAAPVRSSGGRMQLSPQSGLVLADR